MTKPTQKYRMELVRIWRASKRGTDTGFGDSPKDAYNDAMKRKKKRNEQAHDYNKLRSYCQNEMAIKARRIAELEDELSKQDFRLEGWVMMAMAHLGERDPFKAIRKMELRGAGVGQKECDAAKNVAEYAKHWKNIPVA